MGLVKILSVCVSVVPGSLQFLLLQALLGLPVGSLLLKHASLLLQLLVLSLQVLLHLLMTPLKLQRHRKEETVSTFSSMFLQFTIPTNRNEKRQALKQIVLKLNQRASCAAIYIFFWCQLTKKKEGNVQQTLNKGECLDRKKALSQY